MTMTKKGLVVCFLCSLVRISKGLVVAPSRVLSSTRRLSFPETRWPRELRRREKLRAAAIVSDEAPTKRSEQWARLRRLVDKDVSLVGLGLLFLVAAAVSDLAVPHYSSRAVNSVVSGDGNAGLALRGLAIASCSSALFTACRGTTFWLAGTRVVSRLRLAMFKNIAAQEIAFFDKNARGTLTNRLSSDATKVADVVSFNLNIILRQTIQAIGGLGYLIYIDPFLGVVNLATLTLASVITHYYGKVARETSKKTQDALGRANAVADEALENIRLMRSFDSERAIATKYGHAVAQAANLQHRAGYAYGASRLLLGLARTLSTVLVLAIGEMRRSQGLIAGDTLLTFVFVSAFVQSAAFDVGDQLAKVEEALGAGTAAFDLANRKPQWSGSNPPSSSLDDTLVYTPQSATNSTQSGMLELRSVSFAYPARKEDLVLREVNITVPPRCKVACVGSSGSGKSSVTRLLLRHYQADKGSVTIDGIDVSDIPQRELARRIAYVEQEPKLFDGTIAENIQFGLDPDDPLASEDKILNAATRARVTDFTQDLPDGLNTRVGAGGGFLSGGQKSRVAIARALLRQPDVIILDEPTAALDAQSEKYVQQALDAVDCSMLIVAHRLSTIQKCDNIYVMQNGQVIEEGSHAQLVAKRGTYYSMVKQQNLHAGEGDRPRFNPACINVTDISSSSVTPLGDSNPPPAADVSSKIDECVCKQPDHEQDDLVLHERG